MKGKGNIIVLLAALACLALVLGFLAFKNERERSIDSLANENLYNGKIMEGFEFSEGDYIQYETNNEARYGAMSVLYPTLEAGKNTDNHYEIIVKDRFGKELEEILLGGKLFVKEGKYRKDESLFFTNLLSKWELVEKYDSVLKYRYENKHNFTFEQEEKPGVENLTVLIDGDTGIPVGAYWISKLLEAGAETHHYLTIENTNIQYVKDCIYEYERFDIFFHLN
ncbi:hypothetical protein AKJ51_02460 [candidate division MSBL1 archaeon SCGC-AAA382A20]|uniref:Lipoprotein n=1 Tax=candidate division MSBL1 archaeon SCGC-AAA382A20 TaxID=1698280 RepID=A0A133VKK9_9EURY|nr:hypothetical protein AKJ51_02460 [candidate division MSBL1 archaeon SCGC-AAA382A20]